MSDGEGVSLSNGRSRPRLTRALSCVYNEHSTALFHLAHQQKKQVKKATHCSQRAEITRAN